MQPKAGAAPSSALGGRLRTRSCVRRELGAALLVLLIALALLGSLLLLERARSRESTSLEREGDSAGALAESKSALIARAVTASSPSGARVTPGLLPFPDRNRDGNYDGKGDCVTFGLNDAHLLGRLPWAGDTRPCPRIGLGIDFRDASGERLWYAVSRNVVTRGGGGPVNPGMLTPGTMAHPWIAVRGADGEVISDPANGMPLPIAAVIIAPGSALAGQDRSAAAPAASNFLDTIMVGANTFDNSDADGCPDAVTSPCGAASRGEEFVSHPGARAAGVFNDRLITISAHELTRAVEKRVLGEVAIALNSYRNAHGAYPWLAEFHDPRTMAFKSNLAREGLLPIHLPRESFSTSFHGSWNFVDSTPTSAVRHTGNRALAPPLADLQSGSFQVIGVNGRCLWSDWTRLDCRGFHSVSKYYRGDLNRSVTRTVEVSFHVVDRNPEVIPPTSEDVRRRALSVRAFPLPPVRSLPGDQSSLLPEVGWSVRITDDDGIDRAQREIRIDANTGGEINVRGVRFDLSIVYDDVDDSRDELPEWFAENDWHHFIYVALSSDAVAGGNSDGDDDCTTPVNTCLAMSVDGTIDRNDVRALLISAGAETGNQDRAIGDCDGDGVVDDFLCAYLERENSEASTSGSADVYARDRYSAHFNDQVRIVAPLPP